MRRTWVWTACLGMIGLSLAGAGCTALDGLDQDYKEVDCFPSGTCDASADSTAGDAPRGDSAAADSTAATDSTAAADSTTSGDSATTGDSTTAADQASLDGGTGEDSTVDSGQVAEGGEGGGSDASEDTGCPTSDLDCDGGCVANDVHNCGSCGHDCTVLPHVTGSVSCTAGGTCSFPLSSCAPGWTHCSANPDQGCETNIASTSNCGGCGNACTGGTPVCSGSGSTYQCTSGCSGSTPTLCNGACVDTTSNPSDCGTCGNVCATQVTHAQPTCVSSACGYTCNSGYVPCGGSCVDEDTDPNNCGGCGVVCPSGGTCSSGVCACPVGDLACGGVCAVCSTPQNAMASCSGSSCSYTCNGGYTGCASGCWDTSTDSQHCGSSCSPCQSPPTCQQLPATCSSGTCSYTNQGDGAGCGTNATCQGGACTCESGYTSCTSGCTMVSSDSNNCGTCGHVCPTLTSPSQGTTCSGGFCTGYVGGYQNGTGLHPSVVSNVIYAVEVTLPDNAEVTTLDVEVTGGSGSATVTMGIYESSGGAPSSLFYQGSTQTLSNGVGTVTIGADVTLPAGTYWIAMLGTFGASSSVNLTTSVTCVQAGHASGSFPSTFPGGATSCGDLGLYMTAEF